MKSVVTKLGSISGVGSVLSSWQICHSLCLGLVALLGVVGITVTGFPLLFLTTWAPYLWGLAVLMLIATYVLAIKKNCISKNLLIFNTGVVIAGFPVSNFETFANIEGLQLGLWVVGGVIAGTGIMGYISDRRQKKTETSEPHCHSEKNHG